MTLTPIANGGFETAGAEPGDALGWDLITKATVEEYAEFTGPPSIAFEGFELGWENEDYLLEFEPTDVEAALFGPEIPPVEFDDMELGWDNDSWGDELLNPIPAVFDTGTPQDWEDFEEEWDSNEAQDFWFTGQNIVILEVTESGLFTIVINHIEVTYSADSGDTPDSVATELTALIDALPFVDATFIGSGTIDVNPSGTQDFLLEHPQTTDGSSATIVTTNTSGRISAATFDTGTPESHEDFEEEWRDNENYKFAFVGVGTDLTLAVFDTGTPEPYEDFEEEFPTLVMQTI